MASTSPLLEIRDLRIHFFIEEGVVKAVDGLSFALSKGETLAIVGESGSGKSVASMAILGLVQMPPGKVVSGEIWYEGRNLLACSQREISHVRGNEISMVFQEPLTSLNPVFRIGRQIMDPLTIHMHMKTREARSRATGLLELVGIPDPTHAMNSYPHEFSGGMRQRAMIAMSLACNPHILIADEPTTALDVTIQAQILKLIQTVRERTGAAVILITHDLGVVAQMAQNVLVMYAGQAIEYAPSRLLYKQPLHPYTSGLLRSIPKLAGRVEMLYSIKGSVPSARDMPNGCRFHTRCEFALPQCEEMEPPSRALSEGRIIKCWKYAEGSG